MVICHAIDKKGLLFSLKEEHETWEQPKSTEKALATMCPVSSGCTRLQCTTWQSTSVLFFFSSPGDRL